MKNKNISTNEGNRFPLFQPGHNYSLRQIANKLGVMKTDRQTYFKALRKWGIIDHDNTPTILAQYLGFFRLDIPVKRQCHFVTYDGALIISDIVNMSYLLYPSEYDFDIDKPYLSEKTRQRFEKKWPPGQGW